jgi:hypothetical protein
VGCSYSRRRIVLALAPLFQGNSGHPISADTVEIRHDLRSMLLGPLQPGRWLPHLRGLVSARNCASIRGGICSQPSIQQSLTSQAGLPAGPFRAIRRGKIGIQNV